MTDAVPRPRVAGEAAPLGILAGGSGVPCEIAEAVTRRGRSVHIVGLRGEAETDIARFSHTWVNWGGIGAMLRAFKAHGCREIVIIGRVRRPNLRRIRPDLGFWTNLPVLLRFLRGGDDAILRLVIGFFERHDLEVIGAHEAAPELIAPAGVLGKCQPDPRHQAAITRGIAVLGGLGPFDAAQATVASAEGLLAVEGADGTDAMLRRLAERVGGVGHGTALRRGAGVLVKVPKPDQERRIDLPAIGPETMLRASAAGLAGVAVLSGQTLIAERGRMLEAADAAGLFVIGIEHGAVAGAQWQQVAARGGIEGLSSLAQLAPAVQHKDDASLAARVIEALEPFWPQATVVVSRGYVLLAEGPGSALGAAERAGRLKPWGIPLLRRRAGVLAMTDIAGELGFNPGEIVQRARASGLAGIAVLRSTRDEAGLAMMRAEADRMGLFLLAPGDQR